MSDDDILLVSFFLIYLVCIVEETQKENDQQAEQNELEQVGGTAEDDIGEAVMYIREREILFGPKSLLALYGPLIMEVCTRNKVYTVSLWK